MMKDIRIDGRLQRVFVLKETNDRVVYISLRSLHRVDYDQLKDISEKYGKDMLEGMKKSKLLNGRNALVQYDDIIQVSLKSGDDSQRMKKPVESLIAVESKNVAEKEVEVQQTPVIETPKAPTPAPKRRGPKPRSAQ